MAEEKKRKYVVKPGMRFGASDRYVAGDTIELTDAEAAAFADKLELYDRKDQFPAGSGVTSQDLPPEEQRSEADRAEVQKKTSHVSATENVQATATPTEVATKKAQVGKEFGDTADDKKKK